MTITGLPGPGAAGRLPSAGAERAMPGDWTAEVPAAPVASRRPRRRLRTTLLWIAESIALLLVAELVSPLFLPPGNHFVHPQKLVIPSVRRGWDLQPNQHAFTHDKAFVTNSLGFRDAREVPPVKDGEFRILSLGDSMAEGLGVAEEDTYARRLEGRLRARHGRIRVINGGVGCYSTWQEVDLLGEKDVAVQPDVVMLQFFWNDLYVRPALVVPLPGDRPREQTDARWQYIRWAKRSRVLSYLREKFEILRGRISPSFDWTHQAMIYEGRTSPYVEQAYHDVAASLEEFKALADRRGFSPLLIVFPIPGQVRASDPPLHMQRRLEAIARKAGLPTLDLLAPMREAWILNPDIYVPGDNTHLSPRGHEVVAKTLEAYLTGHRLVRDAPEPPRPSRAGRGRGGNG